MASESGHDQRRRPAAEPDGASAPDAEKTGPFFAYGEEELAHLRARDKRMAWAIDLIGPIERPVMGDLFASVVDSILGQQISTAAHKTLRARLAEQLPTLDAESLLDLGRDRLQAVGTTYRKADYILSFAQKVAEGSFDVEGLASLPDDEVTRRLCALEGIGPWTAEMLMTFCLQRPDVVSYGDLAILRGMRMLYRHRVIDRKRFERYRRRYSPYGTVASLYLWAIAGGAIPGLTDPAPKKRPR